MRILRFAILFYHAYRSWQGETYRFRKIVSIKDAYGFAWRGSTPTVYRIMMKLIHGKKNVP